MAFNTPKPTREERANMTHDELVRSIWLLDDVIESYEEDRDRKQKIIDELMRKVANYEYKIYKANKALNAE